LYALKVTLTPPRLVELGKLVVATLGALVSGKNRKLTCAGARVLANSPQNTNADSDFLPGMFNHSLPDRNEWRESEEGFLTVIIQRLG
jgi:hypothetical protein